MRMFRAALALSLCGGTLFTFAPLSAGEAQARGTFAVLNANVLPIDRDTILSGQTVLIRNGIIEQVGYVNAPFFVTPDSVEQEGVAQKRAGYDFIKMHGELSREAYARLNAVGKREGIRIIGHAPRTLGIDVVFAERQYALAHAEEFLYDTTGPGFSRDTRCCKG